MVIVMQGIQEDDPEYIRRRLAEQKAQRARDRALRKLDSELYVGKHDGCALCGMEGKERLRTVVVRELTGGSNANQAPSSCANLSNGAPALALRRVMELLRPDTRNVSVGMLKEMDFAV